MLEFADQAINLRSERVVVNSDSFSLKKALVMEWYLTVITEKYALFSGRAGRREYWHFQLTNMILIGMISFGDVMIWGRTGIAQFIYALFMITPVLAVNVRRMHDIGRTGWWCLVPILNLIFACLDSQEGSNQYGDNPKASSADTHVESKTQQSAIKDELVSSNSNVVSDNDLDEKIEHELYEKIAQELDSENVIRSIWTKAYALFDGDDKKIKSYYIKTRFSQLLDEHKSSFIKMNDSTASNPVSAFSKTSTNEMPAPQIIDNDKNVQIVNEPLLRRGDVQLICAFVFLIIIAIFLTH